MKHDLGILVIALCACLGSAGIHGQSNADYDRLVQRGKTQLQSGNNDAALGSANAAIKVNADRWEAYTVAGGALINLKRYEDAADDFSHAIEHAPEAKQAALRDLRKQCLLAEAGATAPPGSASGPTASSSSSSGPSYAETVKWIQEHIKRAGIPAFGTTPATNSQKFMALSFSPYEYDAQIDGCNSVTVTITFSQYFDAYDDESRSSQRDTTAITVTTVIPVQSAQIFFSDTNVDAKWLPQRAADTSFQWIADGTQVKVSWLNAIKDSMGNQAAKYWVALTPVQSNPKTDGVYSDTRGAVFVVPKDQGIRVTRVANPSEDPPMIPPQPQVDIPLDILEFQNPGSEGENAHMAKALQHLITLCRQNPNAAPKDVF